MTSLLSSTSPLPFSFLPHSPPPSVGAVQLLQTASSRWPEAGSLYHTALRPWGYREYESHDHQVTTQPLPLKWVMDTCCSKHCLKDSISCVSDPLVPSSSSLKASCLASAAWMVWSCDIRCHDNTTSLHSTCPKNLISVNLGKIPMSKHLCTRLIITWNYSRDQWEKFSIWLYPN